MDQPPGWVQSGVMMQSMYWIQSIWSNTESITCLFSMSSMSPNPTLTARFQNCS